MSRKESVKDFVNKAIEKYSVTESEYNKIVNTIYEKTVIDVNDNEENEIGE